MIPRHRWRSDPRLRCVDAADGHRRRSLDSWVHVCVVTNLTSRQVRVCGHLTGAVIPPLVATATLIPSVLAALRGALQDVMHDPALADTREALQLAGFAQPTAADYEPLAALGREMASAFNQETT
jgi:hypothetical protein